MRVGFGYDVHRLVEDRRLVLGGVEIEYDRGLLGHSDADVLLHAVIDAILGAAALGDIGAHFPPGDPAYKDVSSLKLLEETYLMISEKGLEIGNVDATIVCETPKLLSFIPQMTGNIAETIKADIGRINVKATTTEGLGFTGTSEGISAYSVVLLTSRGDNS